jgi:hypothetical protein
MALGVSYGSGGAGGEFMAYVSYDSRAGRMSRADRTQDSAGNYQNEKVDITNTFKAVMDMENIEVGWMVFTAGAAPQSLMVKIGEPIPPKPNGDWKMGAKVIMKLSAGCGGDIREMSSTAASFMRGFDELHDAYNAARRLTLENSRSSRSRQRFR